MGNNCDCSANTIYQDRNLEFGKQLALSDYLFSQAPSITDELEIESHERLYLHKSFTSKDHVSHPMKVIINESSSIPPKSVAIPVPNQNKASPLAAATMKSLSFQSSSDIDISQEVYLFLFDKSTYKGSFVDGCMEGFGERISKSGEVYRGNFRQNLKQGEGELFLNNGDYYIGEFDNNLPSGKGKYIFKSNGSIYIGAFSEGAITGQGKIKTKSGTVYTGEFIDGIKEGKGTLEFGNGTAYNGFFKNNKIEGKGMYIDPSGEVYEGDWKEGLKHGLGTLKTKEGLKYTGEFKNNKQHGSGILTWYNTP